MIKLAYTVATPDTADPGMMAVREPLVSAFRTLAAARYDAAELMIRDPAALDAREIRRQAADSGLAIAAVSTGQLGKEDKLSLASPEADVRRRTVDRLLAVVDFTAEAGGRLINIGTVRGMIKSGPALLRHFAVEALRPVCDRAVAAGVRIAIEPQTRYVVDWLHTVDETVAFSNEVGGPGAPGVLFDVYHAFLEERSFWGAFQRALPHMLHFQVSDSNRRAPGFGHWPWVDIVEAVEASPYDGYVSVECSQRPDSAACIAHAARFLRSLGR